MSSETSTDALQPWQLFTLAGLIGATVVVFASRSEAPAGIVLLSLVIFAAAVVGLAAWRTLAPLTSGEEPAGPQVLGGRTRAALERDKALVLRAIKDLEFDRAMGKVAEKDFAELSTRLRLRAAGLIRQLDAGTGYRAEIEQEVARRVGSLASGPAAREAGAARSGPGDERESGDVPAEHSAEEASGAVPVANQCGSCATGNDADARFCKHCGAALRAPA